MKQVLFKDQEDPMKTLIKLIDEKLKTQCHITLQVAKDTICTSASGFYWIYTKLSLNRFIDAPRPSNTAHIDFSKMAKLHKCLNSVIAQNNEDYWCIYNGKGKQLKNRLLAAFTNTAGTTGKLALTRCYQEDDFRIKFITCQINDTKHGINKEYDAVQRDLERVWRLHYGWPLLCRT